MLNGPIAMGHDSGNHGRLGTGARQRAVFVDRPGVEDSHRPSVCSRTCESGVAGRPAGKTH